MRLSDSWLKVLQTSSLDPCPQAAEEILQLRELVFKLSKALPRNKEQDKAIEDVTSYILEEEYD